MVISERSFNGTKLYAFDIDSVVNFYHTKPTVINSFVKIRRHYYDKIW